MYRISELAQKVALSRSTLLYYEKLGLISSTRQANGYRSYSEHDLQQLRLLQQLQAGGLTLKECQACLETRIDRSLLLERLQALEHEIEEKQQSRDLLAAMLGMASMRGWHQALENQAPGAHLAWLLKQGFDEKQALRLKWLSKDMNEHDHYMADFERIFDGLDRLGPGSAEDTLQALRALPVEPQTLLDIGCGRGVGTVLLARHTQGLVTAVDNDEYNLARLRQTVVANALQQRVSLVCASMTALPFENASFDALWAEGSAYIMGFTNALDSWRRLLKPQGFLVVSDLIWRTDKPRAQAASFWQKNYPGMTTLENRVSSIRAQGYRVLQSFPLSRQAWENYLAPLREKVAGLSADSISSKALVDLEDELDIHQRFLDDYGYQLFVLQKERADS
ncbi:MerR family transcriptional regulator [Pseudomonas rubra]|uniref:MerR family transcriptional regulator n=1 Tax=Pseudomonas rubra TaxID=2942627 RepID=A0ABT5PG85_9PSED|nr:MerR family transcriptional regulator [Pseudomonas rubra]MDD1017322.1 MerR family transcriptional regulator [Pseudomonas rubra]MDD1039132.1 MerR family transcriptional regulator [Pseudomonas rubra]MDD1156949.1 MerR family transcriptional regulator [Pseudomonas rubra]